MKNMIIFVLLLDQAMQEQQKKKEPLNKTARLQNMRQRTNKKRSRKRRGAKSREFNKARMKKTTPMKSRKLKYLFQRQTPNLRRKTTVSRTSRFRTSHRRPAAMECGIQNRLLPSSVRQRLQCRRMIHRIPLIRHRHRRRRLFQLALFHPYLHHQILPRRWLHRFPYLIRAPF